ncbi:cupin [Mycobacterium sp. 4D054]|uniref:cupin n=1 Tax=unclassified Mycobacterium TaxID=2642494 RepID=UPI0021B3594B|nr:cupin [Mycobacterium sp. SMC-8]UXA09981.1 cupin [Mycobacterium sp. SMC-8]
MDVVSLKETAAEQLEAARNARAGRAAHTVYGGHEHKLRQTAIALLADQRLDDHESPGEATLLVLHGRVRLNTSSASAELGEGEYLIIPSERHNLAALEDSVILLTVVTGI